jgi:hypothetical protein
VRGVPTEDLGAADSGTTVVRILLFGAEVVLTAVFCHYLVHDIRNGQHTGAKIVFFVALLSALVVHFLAVFRGATLELERNYNIYDAAHSAAARWWMPYKADTADAISSEGFIPRGSPGRWKLPDDNSGAPLSAASLLS